MIDLSQYSLPQLQTLRSEIDRAIEQRRKTDKLNALEKVKAVARETGFDLAELLGGKRPRANAGVPVPVKYRSKTDPSLTWTGRGRAPRWVQEFLNAGGNIRDLQV